MKITFHEFINESNIIYPTLKQVRYWLKNNLYSHVDYVVLDAYIVGSVAKGTDNEKSDLDIAVVIPPSTRVTALKRTELYHQKFTSDNQKPTYNGKIIDFQFFYPDDAELKDYTKIKLT